MMFLIVCFLQQHGWWCLYLLWNVLFFHLCLAVHFFCQNFRRWKYFLRRGRIWNGGLLFGVGFIKGKLIRWNLWEVYLSFKRWHYLNETFVGQSWLPICRLVKVRIDFTLGLRYLVPLSGDVDVDSEGIKFIRQN